MSAGRVIGSLGLLATRLALGGLFVFAAWSKLQITPEHWLGDVRTFAESIKAFRIIPGGSEALTIQAAYMIPWLELFAGVFLIFGLWTRASAAVIGGLLLVFIFAILRLIYYKYDATCACFGKFKLLCEGPVGWCKVGENFALFLLALPSLFWGGGLFSVDGLRRPRRTTVVASAATVRVVTPPPAASRGTPAKQVPPPPGAPGR